MNRLVDGALGKAAHPKQSLFEFIQIFFEVAFHDFLPVAPTKLNHCAVIDKQQCNHHPKRPVM
jgi:hypothetical protein